MPCKFYANDIGIPLYAFARQLGNDRESARDLVQGFFERLLSRQ